MFKFSSIGHAFASIAHDIVVGARAVEGALAKVQAAEPTIEAVTSVISPQASLIERAAFGILGKVLGAVQGADAAAAAGGINLQLDEQEIADLKEIVATLKSHPFSVSATK